MAFPPKSPMPTPAKKKSKKKSPVPMAAPRGAGGMSVAGPIAPRPY